ncbi:hypothetical protein GALMADRAFT_883866 [Galerina marginata CBS 339.88]|uniref:Uncharacterized protein n=1 Tax=Galerina marginata (strain CBS 339.88) TaxID=685588 RepID=A0A067SK48_GALM3|nr:hypothetical protein GALMADRAFT_883866 [Galerina marginata CBS 339.88]
MRLQLFVVLELVDSGGSRQCSTEGSMHYRASGVCPCWHLDIRLKLRYVYRTFRVRTNAGCGLLLRLSTWRACILQHQYVDNFCVIISQLAYFVNVDQADEFMEWDEPVNANGPPTSSLPQRTQARRRKHGASVENLTAWGRSQDGRTAHIYVLSNPCRPQLPVVRGVDLQGECTPYPPQSLVRRSYHIYSIFTILNVSPLHLIHFIVSSSVELIMPEMDPTIPAKPIPLEELTALKIAPLPTKLVLKVGALTYQASVSNHGETIIYPCGDAR